MNQINYCYFIRILFDVIQEKKLDNINSILLFYTYSLISYNTLCIYNLKLQKFNSEQKKNGTIKYHIIIINFMIN